jgi:hypothetical protein
MGSDQLLDRLLPRDRDKDADDPLRTSHDALYATYWSSLRPLPGAVDLLRARKAQGLAVVLASSAGQAESGVFVGDTVRDVRASRGAVRRAAQRRHQPGGRCRRLADRQRVAANQRGQVGRPATGR